MITAQNIKNTDCYKNMDNVQRSLIVKKTQLQKITLGVNMSKLQTFEFWVSKTNPRHHVKSMVMEIGGYNLDTPLVNHL